jgi:hypothetical protein
MNVANTTTGLVPFCVGSVEFFQVKPFLNGVPWFLGGGIVSVSMTDYLGNNVSLTASISLDGYTATTQSWTVVGSASAGNTQGPWTWTRAWTIQDAQGRKQVCRPIVFAVINSPGVPSP